MKAGLLAVAAFSAVAFAQPHRRHVALHEREAAVETQWFTQVDVVTATAPAAVVYVDQNGQPIAGPTDAPIVNAKFGGDHQGDHQDQGQHGHGQGQGGHGPVPAPAQSTTAAPAPAQNTPAPVVPVVSIPAVVVPPVVASPAPVDSGSGSSGSSGSGLGITYSPYTDGPCKDASHIKKDIAGLSAYSTIRLYGTDCNQIASVMDSISSNQKVLLGIFDIDGRLDGEISSLQSQVNGRWGQVSAVTVGNELIANKKSSVGAIQAALSTTRSKLSGSFSGPIGTVDTVDGYTADNNALCATADKDTVFVNCHPFFANGVQPDRAGDFVATNQQAIAKACNVKNVIITETGWPSSTVDPGLFVNRLVGAPTVSSQKIALDSIRSNFTSNLFLFSAYDEKWKPDVAGTLGVEQHWGVLGAAPA